MDAQSLNTVQESILRVASYHRRDFDLAVARVNPADERVRNSLLRPSPIATATLGNLSSLPLEILWEIFRYLDIVSLLNVRHVNKRAAHVVCGIPHYRVVVEHALDTLCVVLRTKIAPYFTFCDLQRILYMKNCLLCDSFGGFVFLPSLTRCCFSCAESALEFRIITSPDLKRFFKQTFKQVSKLVPVLKSLPGMYSRGEALRKRSIQLLSLQQAADALKKQPAGDIHMFKEAPLVSYMATAAMPYVEKATGVVEHGVACAGCRAAIEDPDVMSTEELFMLHDKLYSRVEFLRHFKECKWAKELWQADQTNSF
ncbi:hypothetical protein BDV06DRAFT_223939 [Aspergillus oleicola]